MTTDPKQVNDGSFLSLEDVLTTDELHRRPARTPDYAAENQALSALIEAMAEAPETLLQRLADQARALCRADSAAISIWEPGQGAGMCRWHGVSGQLNAKVGDTMPREMSPCRVVSDRDAAWLLSNPERHFRYGKAIDPPIVEALLVPLRKGGKPFGSIWVIAHKPTTRFDDEDRRLLESLSRFASAACLTTGISKPLPASESQSAAEAMALARLNQASSRLWGIQKLRDGLEEMLEATIELLCADMGNVQLLDTRRGVLTIAAQRGFEKPFLDFFREVTMNDDSACARALRTGQRTIIEDVETDEAYAPYRHIALEAGYRAVQSTPIMARDGSPLGIVSTHFHERHRPGDHELQMLDLYVRQAADFIERCFIDEVLKRSEEQFKALAEASSNVVYRMSPDWTEMRRLVGRNFIADTHEPSRTWLQKYIHPDDQPHVMATIDQAIRTKSVFELEHRVLRIDGSPGWTFSRAIPIFDEKGEIVEWLGMASDVTEKHKAQEAVYENRAMLAAILDNATDAIITIDEQGVMESVNRAACLMFGYRQEEMVGRNVSMLMPPKIRKEHDSYLARYLATGERKIIGIGRETFARRKNGTEFPIELAVSEIDSKRQFTGIVRDITRRKELEKEVVEIASLEQRRIGQDLHDTVCQDLTALSIHAANLAESLPEGSTVAAGIVQKIIQGLHRSREDLRTVMRRLLPIAVSGERIMAAFADLAERTQNDKRVTCTFECPTPVAFEDNLTAMHLFLIGQEAVHNALKHADPGHIRIILESGDRIRLTVQDDGKGFAQSNKSAANAEAGGLGLRIMHNRAAIIGAVLIIEPIQPNGTRVTCTLARKEHD